LLPAIAWNILQEKKIKIKLLEHEELVLEIFIIIFLKPKFVGNFLSKIINPEV